MAGYMELTGPRGAAEKAEKGRRLRPNQSDIGKYTTQITAIYCQGNGLAMSFIADDIIRE